mmetsp:Transcript_21880/g.32607  ORF Transcript_21880/g.32607 Transcript_21880/m.32607 type:complete len:90 (+) Transcript_21880:554-823(+)
MKSSAPLRSSPVKSTDPFTITLPHVGASPTILDSGIPRAKEREFEKLVTIKSSLKQGAATVNSMSTTMYAGVGLVVGSAVGCGVGRGDG